MSDLRPKITAIRMTTREWSALPGYFWSDPTYHPVWLERSRELPRFPVRLWRCVRFASGPQTQGFIARHAERAPWVYRPSGIIAYACWYELDPDDSKYLLTQRRPVEFTDLAMRGRENDV